MPKKLETTVYTYDELDEKAQQKAREWMLENSYHDNWWECTYEDAEQVGLKLTEFDLDRNRHAKGEFIAGPLEVAENILKEHGESCETYKTALQFKTFYVPMIEKLDQLQADDELVEQAMEYESQMEDHADEFLAELLEDYSIMLQKESEYLSSDEHIEETIRANEYTFLENGKRFG